jgi:hypothetical protein
LASAVLTKKLPPFVGSLDGRVASAAVCQVEDEASR